MTSPALGRSSRALAALVAVSVFAGMTVAARAEWPQSSVTLHEQIPEDPREDVGYSATTLEGDLPAAIQTPSGLTTAPDPQRSPGGGADHVYGGTTTDDSPDSTYEPDRDTRRPKIENYDDPFSPATAPFKRLRAYDWVDADYSLRVRDRSLQKLPVGGSMNNGDEPFYGDLSVDLLPGEPVRIPTVGPGTRVLRMHANPEVPVEIVRDGADNWFARGTTRTRVRLVVELAIPRDTFGREFGDVEWSVLDAVSTGAGNAGSAGFTGPKPAARLHEAAFNEVAHAVGISRSVRPREVVHRMVEYFRAFEPSNDPPSGRGDIYLDLALSKKGVCRHRAFAFLVTALGIGIPARMVVNEAHAWVEVYDSKLWHRIDLGGAAANLQNENDPNKPPYLPPPDPYAWPASRDSGQDLADRNRAEQSAQTAGGSGNGSPGGSASSSPSAGSPAPSASSTASPAASTSADPGASPPDATETKLPASDIALGAIDGDVHRGLPLHLQGSVASSGTGCGHLRVDVVLVPHTSGASDKGDKPAPPLRRRHASARVHVDSGSGVVVGSLSTDDRGRFDGAVVVPRDLAVGDYDVVVQTVGDARCGPGQTL